MQEQKDIIQFIKSKYDVDLEVAIKYLCGLCRISESCKTTRFKNQQLLIIYKLCCMKNNINIWNYAKIILNENKRLSLRGYYFIDCYSTFCNFHSVKNINKKIEEDLTDISKIPKSLKLDEYEMIDDEAKELLTEIFREFGGYDSMIINNMLEEITINFLNQYSIEDFDYIDESLKSFLQDDRNFKILKLNRIMNFINNYNFVSKNDKLSFNLEKVVSEFRRKFINLSYEEQKNY